jgi:hypothetical protein
MIVNDTVAVLGRCKTCAHWSPFDEERYQYDAIVRHNKLGLCRLIGEAKDSETIDGIIAMADDASGLQSMRTAATFGCVLWESK